MTTQELERELRERLKGAGLADLGFEVRQILCHILSVDAADLLMMTEAEISDQAAARARAWVEQRSRGLPLAYLSGVKGFYKFDFLVEPGVLVPRPETELVVEEALARVSESGLKIKTFADLGCGTGCIGLSLLSQLTEAELFALDSSELACEITLRNAQSLQAEEYITVINRRVEDWQPSASLQLVVTNPPYIPENDPQVEKGVHAHEPHAALYSGADGLDAIRSWSQWAHKNLAFGGIFVCEFGAGQSAAVKDIITKADFKDLSVKKDLAGIDRVISAVKR